MSAGRRGLGGGLLRFNGAVVLAFLYAPIILLVVFSFSASRLPGQWGGFTTEWYQTLFDDSRIQRTIWVSLRVALVSTVISTVLGTMSALALERFRFRGRRVFDALLYLPIIIPDVTMAVMMLMFFTQAFDLLEVVFGLGLSKGFATIIVSHVAFNIAFVSVVVRARVAGMDATLEQAAADLYASRWQTFRYVTLPLIAPGVLGGALLAITLSLDDVVVTQFVAGPGSTTLPVYVFSLIRKGVTPTINAVSVIMLVASLILVAGSVALQRASAARGRQRLQTTGGIQ
ncbi:MAG: ABC transporter permease [Actinomycetota bacterium]|nr:ABC transporter permease [Actinomycetota bacterium]MDA3014615.1 ABC transporter permease [Actinomycetota bacterium]MDA3027288.1 ABC transporter permease [Actinomycetota bacterium]